MKLGRIVAAGVAAVLLIAAVIGGGSILYWFAEGRPGTPEQFTDRVAESGLEVTWTNAGPRGGDGVVAADCGPVHVMVSELDGELWLITPVRRPLDAAAAAAVVGCDPG